MISIDFITDLLASNGYNALFIVIDKFSKIVKLIACRDTTTAKEVARLYFHHAYTTFDLLVKIIFDRRMFHIRSMASIVSARWYFPRPHSDISPFSEQSSGKNQPNHGELVEMLDRCRCRRVFEMNRLSPVARTRIKLHAPINNYLHAERITICRVSA